MTAYQKGKNPFSSEADDEFSFGGSSRAGTRDFDRQPGGYSNSGRGGFSRDDELFSSSSSTSYGEPMSRYEELQQQKQQSMNRQLESTNRCLASIYDSERIGIDTAEELLAQGEQLDNVERKLDKILVDTKTSQRHLNGIKSIFGGIKNWWSGEGKKEEATTTAPPVKKQSASLQQAMSADRPSGPHPAFVLRSGDTRGFYDEDVVDYNPNDSSGYGSQRTVTSSTSRATTTSQVASSGYQSEKPSGRSAEMREYEQNLDKNLELMSGGLSRLKMLATGLGDEIETQNDQIENRIMVKVDKADIKIKDQNRQMRQILGK